MPLLPLTRLLTAAAVIAATGAAAQMPDAVLDPSAALACLTPPAAERGLPTYPAQELERGDGGTLVVELRFDAPDAAPRVSFPDHGTQFSGLVDAVRRHVRQLRVPCMTPGKPVTLRQRYVFTTGDVRRVVAEPPTDPAQLVRRQLVACLAHTDGRSRGPAYPYRAADQGLEGKVFVRLRFEKPGSPPVVQRLSPRRSNLLTQTVESHVGDLRMPCLQDDPVSFTQLYVFRLEGGARVRLQPMTLLEFLQAAEHIPRPVSIDLDTMGCPFDLRLSLMQPYADNEVLELEAGNPARAPLLQWLAGVRMKLNVDLAEKVVGEETTLLIPCGKVSL